MQRHARRRPSLSPRTSIVNSTTPGMTLTAPDTVLRTPDGAHRARGVEADSLDRNHRFGCRRECIAPEVHGDGPCVACPPHDLHPQSDGAGHGGHDSNRQILRFEHRSLLDVHLDIGGDVVRTVAGFAHRIRVESELAHRFVKVHAVLVDGGKRRRVEIAGDGLAADQRCLDVSGCRQHGQGRHHIAGNRPARGR